MSLSLISLCLALVADEPPSPEKAAVIQVEQDKARAEVSAKFGNKKPTELSAQERKELEKDMDAASKAVLEKNGVDPKQYARDQLKMGRAGYAEKKELVKEIVAKEKAAAEAKKKAENQPKEIQVQRGVSEENPVTLDEKPNEDGNVPVEKGLPPDAQNEQDALSAQDSASSAPAEAAPSPSKGGGGKGSKRR